MDFFLAMVIILLNPRLLFMTSFIRSCYQPEIFLLINTLFKPYLQLYYYILRSHIALYSFLITGHIIKYCKNVKNNIRSTYASNKPANLKKQKIILHLDYVHILQMYFLQN